MKKVKYVMTKDVAACGPNNSLAEVGAKMWENNCGALPVLDNEGKVIGMITDRDICIALTTRGLLASEVKVGKTMSKRIYTCSIDDDLGDALEVMRKEKVRRVPVVDRDNILRGIITLSDILVRAEETTGAAITLKVICEDIKPLELAAH